MAAFFIPASNAQPAGSPDLAWTPTPVSVQGESTWISAIVEQPDGKVAAAVTGSFTASTGLARFLPSGALDDSLDGDGVAWASVDTHATYTFDLALAADGRYYLSGYAHNPNVTALFVERRLANGELDTAFGGTGQVRYAPSANVCSAADMLQVQPDGKVLVMGFDDVDVFATGFSKLHVVRFNADGSLDSSFGTNGVVLIPLAQGLGSGNGLRLAADGSIYVLGHDYENSGGFVIKLTAAGVPDANFGVSGKVGGQANNGLTPLDLALQQDGKLVLTGRYRGPNGFGVMLTRLFANGALDFAFGNGGLVFHDPTPGDDHGAALALDAAGRILVAANLNVQPGQFGIGLVYDSVALARFMPSGVLDTYFGQRGYVVPPGAQVLDLEQSMNGEAVYLLTAQYTPVFSSLIHKYLARNAAPTVTLLTGGRTVQDSDGVPGEIVTLAASAEDSDGVIVSTEWVVDGTVAGKGTTLTIALGDGTHSVGFRATDNEGAVSVVSEPFAILAPIAPLPRSGCTSAAAGGTCDAEFALSVRDQSGALAFTPSVGQAVTVAGFVFPQAGDRGATADAFLVVNTPQGWFMRNTAGRFVPWSTRKADLVPVLEDVVLTEPLRVPAFTALLPVAGTYAFYVGYRRGAALVYMAEPVRVTAH